MGEGVILETIRVRQNARQVDRRGNRPAASGTVRTADGVDCFKEIKMAGTNISGKKKNRWAAGVTPYAEMGYYEAAQREVRMELIVPRSSKWQVPTFRAKRKIAGLLGSHPTPRWDITMRTTSRRTLTSFARSAWCRTIEIGRASRRE